MYSADSIRRLRLLEGCRLCSLPTTQPHSQEMDLYDCIYQEKECVRGAWWSYFLTLAADISGHVPLQPTGHVVRETLLPGIRGRGWRLGVGRRAQGRG